MGLTFCLDWPQTAVLLISASWVVGITGMDYCTWPWLHFWKTALAAVMLCSFAKLPAIFFPFKWCPYKSLFSPTKQKQARQFYWFLNIFLVFEYVSSHSLLAWKVSAGKTLIILHGFPCMEQFAFWLLFSNFVFNFWHLIMTHLGVGFLRLILFGVFWASWIWVSISFPGLRSFLPLLLWIWFLSLSFSGSLLL
jgi:hypothetical protein